MRNVLRGAMVVILALLGVVVGGFVVLVLWSLPGLRLLPKARRVALDGVTTIEDAIAACQPIHQHHAPSRPKPLTHCCAPRVERDERLRLRDEAILALLVYAGLRVQEVLTYSSA
jgi:hypothetical protein